MSFITQPKRTFFRALGFVTVATLTSLAWHKSTPR